MPTTAQGDERRLLRRPPGQTGKPALAVEAYRALGVPLFWLGDVTAALGQLVRGAAAYDAERHRSHDGGLSLVVV